MCVCVCGKDGHIVVKDRIKASLLLFLKQLCSYGGHEVFSCKKSLTSESPKWHFLDFERSDSIKQCGGGLLKHNLTL